MINLHTALSHFSDTDPKMHELLLFGLESKLPLEPPAAKNPDQYFKTLASSINSQQISIKAADSIWKRFEDLVQKITPENVLAKTDDELASVGLSRQKRRYMRSLAEYAHTHDSFYTVHERDNEAVIAELTEIVGIGRWTVEMFLMFALARPDVFSYGDLGLMRSLETNYGIHYKDVKAAQKIIDPLSPHRTAAAMALWRHKDGEPILL